MGVNTTAAGKCQSSSIEDDVTSCGSKATPVAPCSCLTMPAIEKEIDSKCLESDEVSDQCSCETFHHRRQCHQCALEGATMDLTVTSSTMSVDVRHFRPGRSRHRTMSPSSFPSSSRRATWASTVCLMLVVCVSLLSTMMSGTEAAKKAAESIIEDVNGKQLEKIIQEKDYVAVYWYTKRCGACDKVLAELEKIDDDTDDFGVDFVKIGDKKTAKAHGVTTFPTLQYFRNQEPITYDGDLMDEDKVLEFLTSLDAMELPDQIEEVNAAILEKIVDENEFVAVLFCPDDKTCAGGPANKKQCRMCEMALKELENIDDEADQLGIAFVKINDENLAQEYSLESLPALVYYRRQVPIIYDGDLLEEEMVLEWLVRQKSTGDDNDVIEDVSARTLSTLIHSVQNLAVLFYDDEDEDSMTALTELENIDDECDGKGIQFVKIDDTEAAKEFGIDDFPALVYFENQIPNIYEGDLHEEESVLEWLLGQLTSDEIEDVNDEMLDRLIAKKQHLAVLFYANHERESMRVLKDLETIDDECDQHGIAFVKISDVAEAKEYGFTKLPKLVYFENGIPSLYSGDLAQEEQVLEWLIRQVESDEIEDVTDEMLDMLIEKSPYLAVLFYDADDKKSKKALDELENIDDECDSHNITFVKIDDDAEAKEYGIEKLPALVYFEKGIPTIYEGDLTREEQVLEWLLFQKESDEIEEVTDEMLDKLIESEPYLAVLFYDKDDKQDVKILNELETIDDECDQNGIAFVKIDNDAEAKEYGLELEKLPTLVYFENGIPSIYEGDLDREEEVLEWLITQRLEDTIEEVTDEMLTQLIQTSHYVAVYFTGEECDEGERCYKILQELENIDDEADEYGLHFVTTDDLAVAKKYGVKKFPAIVLFRNGEPLLYNGDLEDEDEVLAWLTDAENLEIAEKIESVNAKILAKLLETEGNVAVFFYAPSDRKAERILAELEHIDDECDDAGIDFVKISDKKLAAEYEIASLPALVYFRRKFPQIYEGDLHKEDEVLNWLLSTKDATPSNDVIDLVDRNMLEMLLQHYDNVAVFFFEKNCKTCDKILDGLETIDDDTDKVGIHFVKVMDSKFARELGVVDFPSLVYFENKVPSIFEGDLLDEDQVLEWLVYQKLEDTIENINREMLNLMITTKDYTAVIFYKENDQDCEKTLKHMETIDDEATEYGIEMVKMNDQLMAKKYGCRHPPCLVYFRKSKHMKFDGDMFDEEEVLEWLTDPDTMELNDQIEKVTKKMLEKMQSRSEYLAALFYSETNCKQCERVLTQLENIDDEAKAAGIDFVKVNDIPLAKTYGIYSLPGLAFFRLSSPEPVIFAGDLKLEEKILEWLLSQKDPSGERIEEMKGDDLKDYISDHEFVTVFFYSVDECLDCDQILDELENIDDDTDRHGIAFVKTPDTKVAEDYGVEDFPALIYFERGAPSIYEGDLSAEEDVLQWLILQKTEDRIELVNRDLLEVMIEETQYLAVFFYKSNCKACEAVLTELENIDDECDLFGIAMVKINDPQLAKRYGIKTFPALIYFRNGNPLIFDACELFGKVANCRQVKPGTKESVEAGCTTEDGVTLEEESNGDLQKSATSGDEEPNLPRGYTHDEETEHRLANAIFSFINVKEEPDVEEEEQEEDGDEEEEEIKENQNEDDDEHPHHRKNRLFSRFHHSSKEKEQNDTEVEESEEETERKPSNIGLGILSWLISSTNREIDGEIEMVNLKMLDHLIDMSPLIAVAFMPQGDLRNEEAVLEWLVDDDTRELADEIEAVNIRMLDKLVEDSPFLAVFFYEDECEECTMVLEELENIDDEADTFGIDFVKINDPEAAKEYGIVNLPALVYFRKKIPLVYDGDLKDEERVLAWLTSQDVFEIKDEIEEVNKKMLEKLLDENDFVAVFFYESDCKKCEEALTELEHIDDETDNLDITFVKIKDARYARKYGLNKLPALVYFRRRFPSIYRGDLLAEDEVLDWLTKNRFKQPELNLFMYGLVALASTFILYTLFLLFCFKGPQPGQQHGGAAGTAQHPAAVSPAQATHQKQA